jgi:hypothetical protein
MANFHNIVTGILLVFVLVVMGTALTFAEGQSVSSLNGNLVYSCGVVGSENTVALSWSISLPSVNGTVLQVDGIGGKLDDLAYSGFGFQLFRRNEYGLFGVKS